MPTTCPQRGHTVGVRDRFAKKPTAAKPIRLISTEKSKKLESNAIEVNSVTPTAAAQRGGSSHKPSPAAVSTTTTIRLYPHAISRRVRGGK